MTCMTREGGTGLLVQGKDRARSLFRTICDCKGAREVEEGEWRVYWVYGKPLDMSRVEFFSMLSHPLDRFGYLMVIRGS